MAVVMVGPTQDPRDFLPCRGSYGCQIGAHLLSYYGVAAGGQSTKPAAQGTPPPPMSPRTKGAAKGAAKRDLNPPTLPFKPVNNEAQESRQTASAALPLPRLCVDQLPAWRHVWCQTELSLSKNLPCCPPNALSSSFGLGQAPDAPLALQVQTQPANSPLPSPVHLFQSGTSPIPDSIVLSGGREHTTLSPSSTLQLARSVLESQSPQDS